jgi:signal transduction histidine kinase
MAGFLAVCEGAMNPMLEFACTEEALEKLEAALVDVPSAPREQRLAALLPLAWQLRQRDTTRALLLADEAEACLAVSGLATGERLGMVARLSLIRGEAKWLFGELDVGAALAGNALHDFAACNDTIGCADGHSLLAHIAHDQGDPARRDTELVAMVASVEATDPVRVAIAKAWLARNAAFRDVAAARRDWGPQFATGTADMHPAVATFVSDFFAITAALSGEYVDAIRHFGTCHTLALATGKIRLAIGTATNLGDCFNHLNDHHAALEWMQRALELARPRAWPASMGIVLMGTAETLRLLQRFDAACELLREAMALMATQAASQHYAIALQYLGNVELNLRQYDDALASFQLLAQRGHALARGDLLRRALRGQARALLELDLPHAALAQANVALNTAKSDFKAQIEALRVLADIHARHPLPPPPGMSAASASLHYLQRAHDLATTIVGITIPGDLLEALADEHAKIGDFTKSHQLLKQAIAAHAKIHSSEAANRASAMQVSHETQRVLAEGEHHRKLAAAHAERAEVLEQANSTLEKLGVVGRIITANLDADSVFQSLHLYVGGLLNAPAMMIYRMNAAATSLEAVFGRDEDQIMPMHSIALDSPDSNAARAVRERQELLLNYDPQSDSTHIPGTRQMRTALFAPLIVGDQVLGVMSIQSDKADAWGEREHQIFRTLTAFGAIALANSGTHAKLAESHAELASAHRQLQETQQQLMLQEKMAGLGTLTAGIAHEINNPTNFIHVSAQNLQVEIAEFEKFVAGLIEGDEGQEVLQAFTLRFANLSTNVGSMLNGTERIVAIVKNLRSFSRLDEAATKTVCLSECLRATVNLVRTAWLEKVDFTSEFTDDPELECRPALLNQVFINLLLNGCQAIEAKQARKGSSGSSPANEQGYQRGKLWVRLRLTSGKDALQIEIEDNGTGIEPTIRSRIMEPFFTTKEVGSGTGTGLSTAFGIVQKHGGTLEFTSTPGEGSCFIVTLPLAGVLPPQ